MKLADTTNLRHNVGTCPACREYLWAEVVVETSVGEPRLGADGRASAHLSAAPVAMSVSHECDKREPSPAQAADATLRRKDFYGSMPWNQPGATTEPLIKPADDGSKP